MLVDGVDRGPSCVRLCGSRKCAMHKHQRTIKMNADGAWMGGHSISTQPSVSYDILSLVPVTVMERPPPPAPPQRREPCVKVTFFP